MYHSDDGFCPGCRNVSQHQQQFFSGLHYKPRQSLKPQHMLMLLGDFVWQFTIVCAKLLQLVETRLSASIHGLIQSWTLGNLFLSQRLWIGTFSHWSSLNVLLIKGCKKTHTLVHLGVGPLLVLWWWGPHEKVHSVDVSVSFITFITLIQ